MRFPSLKILYSEARKTFVRFPFVLVAALAAVVAGILAIDDTAHQDAFLNALFTGQLGIPLLFALAVYSEKKAWSKSRTVLIQLIGVAALVVYYFRLPDWLTPTASARFAQLNVALHLLVAFVPYVRLKESNGFWQYNKTLFLRFLTAVLYSAVLYAGLAVALLAIDQLLGVKVEDDTYLKLFLMVALLFNTWFFLGGVPRDLSVLDSSSDYPHGLKVFTQYILVPIVLIYLAILTIYLVKIIVTWEWPSGMIGYLVSAVSAAGIFSLLLVHPIRNQAENRWIRTFSKWFYVWLFPAIIMLFLAIGKRIAQYGITENRYFLAVLTIWLAGTALYFTLSRRKNIKLIPTSLCLIAFATSFGPWGAYQVSENSQKARLSALLTTHRVLVDGRIEPSSARVQFDDRREISAVLSYLIQNHGTRSLEPWFGETLASVDTTDAGTGPSRRGKANERVKLILSYMNVEYVARWERDSDHFNYSSNSRGHLYDISGYDALYRINRRWHQPDSVEVAGELLSFRFDDEMARIEIMRGGEVLIEIAVSPLVDELREYVREHSWQNEIPPEAMRFSAENETIKVVVYFSRISGTRTDKGIDIRHVVGDVLLTLK
jgi:hypothetical protein